MTGSIETSDANHPLHITGRKSHPFSRDWTRGRTETRRATRAARSGRAAPAQGAPRSREQAPSCPIRGHSTREKPGPAVGTTAVTTAASCARSWQRRTVGRERGAQGTCVAGRGPDRALGLLRPWRRAWARLKTATVRKISGFQVTGGERGPTETTAHADWEEEAAAPPPSPY